MSCEAIHLAAKATHCSVVPLSTLMILALRKAKPAQPRIVAAAWGRRSLNQPLGSGAETASPITPETVPLQLSQDKRDRGWNLIFGGAAAEHAAKNQLAYEKRPRVGAFASCRCCLTRTLIGETFTSPWETRDSKGLLGEV